MEHPDIIRRVVETERDARGKVMLAEKERLHLETELASRREDMRLTYMARAEERILTVREKEFAFADAKVAKLEAELKSDLEKDRAYAAENRDRWVDEVFRQVLEFVLGRGEN